MPVEKTDDFINFANATVEEVKEEIVTLFQRQKRLPAFTCQHFMLDRDIRIYQMFIIAVANSDFAKYLYSSIEKKIIKLTNLIHFTL